MGTGYRAGDNERVVMVEPCSELDNFTEFTDLYAIQNQYARTWEDLKQNILGCLSNAWTPVRGRKWVTLGEFVLAESALLMCTLEEDSGGYGYVYVKITARRDLDCPPNEKFLMRLVDRSSGFIFGRLANIYDLRIPLSYVSARYYPAVETTVLIAA